MADMTLADYMGYIFLEIIKAREMADRYARQVAERYAQDPVMKHFSTPRFKVPNMELTIPVLISGARFRQVIQFRMPFKKFNAFIRGRVNYSVNAVRMSTEGIVATAAPQPPAKTARRRFEAADAQSRLPISGVTVTEPPDPITESPDPIIQPPITAPPTPVTSASLDGLVRDFHQQLLVNPEPTRPSNIVTIMWGRIFTGTLAGSGLLAAYQQHYPNNELFNETAADVLRIVTTNTVIDRTTIDNLLVNPETNVVKNGSSDSSVFTIKAEMLEEGFFIRAVRDDKTGQERPVVEFE